MSKYKGKGVFTKPGLAKNPDRAVVYSSVAKFIVDNTPIEQTIMACKDITQFVTVRKVTGGATWQGMYLGKAVRFYYSSTVDKEICIHYAKNSNRVPMSGGARPLMDLPDIFPSDVDYQVYVQMANELLKEVGYNA